MDNAISLLSDSNIKSGQLADLVPEFYELKNVVENNDWHHKENIFDHTLSVLENLEKILRTLNKETKQFLDSRIDHISRRELLKVATLFHDIAKKETFSNNNGYTLCPDHEDEGSIKARRILKRFMLSNKELEFVLQIVRHHGIIHRILALDNGDFKKKYASFKKRFSRNIYPELILLAFADTAGSYLKKTHPAEFKSRIVFYKKEIENLPPRNKI